MARAFIFPGQGAQAVGMGQELAEAFPTARHVLEEVDDALDQHLSRLMAEGPDSDLTLTENAQPALMAVSLATVRVLEEQGGFTLADKGAFVAGHSLGEYTALAATGALGVAPTARLLRTRGRAMQAAVPVGEGAMAALMGLDMDAVRDVTARAARGGYVCAPANDNAPGQIVISGHADAVERAIELAKEAGAKRAVKLSVSAPFHCSLMQPAADAMAEALAETEIAAPSLPVVSNVTAEPVREPDTIRQRLVEQVTASVRWRESMRYLREQEVETLIELGAGKVLSGLAKRIDRGFEALSVATPRDLEALMEKL
jgi:[acyl-carrier-protein] S-malonyltransferase